MVSAAEADVIVCGLGPTGATVSALLASRGVRVIALDRRHDLFPLPRAIGMDHEAMRILQELQLVEALTPNIAPYRPSEYRGVNGQVIRRIEPAPPPRKYGWDSNYVFDQPEFEKVLQNKLFASPSIQTRYSTTLGSVTQLDDCIEATVESRDGAVETLSAKFLLACDGGSSAIRKSLGIVLEDLGFDEYWLVVDADLSEEKIHELPQTQVQYCEPERPCSYVIGPANHRRFEIMLQAGDSLSPEFPEEELWPLLARWLKPGDGRIRRAAAYRFHGLVTPDWRRHRVLLLGDAAHMTPPFMSQGMVQGMRDAQNLAWKLERVLNGESSIELLDTYAQERRPHVVSTTQAAMSLGREICERDPQKAAQRDALLGALAVDGVIPATIRQNLIPALRAGPLITDTPGAGQLCPQPRVKAWGQADFQLFDDVSGVHTRLIVGAAITDVEAELLDERLDGVKGRLIRLVDVACEAPGSTKMVQEDGDILQKWFDGLDRTFALVRPDHYVFGTASSVEDALALVARYTSALNPRGSLMN